MAGLPVSGTKCGIAGLGAGGNHGFSIGRVVAAEDLPLGGVQSPGQCTAEVGPKCGTGNDLAIDGLSCGVVAEADHASGKVAGEVSGLATRGIHDCHQAHILDHNHWVRQRQLYNVCIKTLPW